MKIITINLPMKYLDCIQVLVGLGKYDSRSHAIRVALQNFLESDQKLYYQLELDIFEKMMEESRDG